MNKEITIDIENPKDNDLISRQAALASIKNLYPDIPVMDIFGARRKWVEKYAPYFECENAIEQLPPVNLQKPKQGIGYSMSVISYESEDEDEANN